MRLIIRRWVSLLSFVMNRKKEKWQVAKCSRTNVNVNPRKRTMIFNISCKNLIWLEKRTLCKTGSILMTFHLIAMHCVEVLFLAAINSSSLKNLGGGQSQTDFCVCMFTEKYQVDRRQTTPHDFCLCMFSEKYQTNQPDRQPCLTWLDCCCSPPWWGCFRIPMVWWCVE